MKRTLLAVCISTLALAVAASAEERPPEQNASNGKTRRAAVVKSQHSGTASVQRGRQSKAQQNASARSFRQTAPRTAVTTPRSQRVTARERNSVRRPQEFNTANTANTRRSQRVTAREGRRAEQFNTANTANTNTVNRSVRRENFQRQRELGFAGDRNVTVNRTRNVSRNVTVVNNWRGQRFAAPSYTAFRNYRRAWHDRSWWDIHYGSNLTFVFGAPYFWSSGYWYPAWGYNPGYVYPYDGPIYGYSALTPDRIVANVQIQLRNDGYYDGPIDGVLGPRTRYALAAFQADHGLAVTSAVDEPTLATLGLV
jgi:hypothetical protein